MTFEVEASIYGVDSVLNSGESYTVDEIVSIAGFTSRDAMEKTRAICDELVVGKLVKFNDGRYLIDESCQGVTTPYGETDDAVIANIKYLTEYNASWESLILIALYLKSKIIDGNTELIARLTSVIEQLNSGMTQHKAVGYLTPELSELSHNNRIALFALCEKVLDNDLNRKLYDAL